MDFVFKIPGSGLFHKQLRTSLAAKKSIEFPLIIYVQPDQVNAKGQVWNEGHVP